MYLIKIVTLLLLAWLLIYLSSQHQLLIPSPIGKTGRQIGWLCGGVSFVLVFDAFSPAVGVMFWLVSVMVLVLFWPVLGLVCQSVRRRIRL